MEFNAMNLRWSPSGKQLLFLSGEGRSDTPQRPINLWTINLETGDYQQVTFNFTLGGRPTWSPDEKYIAFTGTDMLEQEEAQYDVWLLDSASYELYRLTDDLATEQNPVWSAGGSKLFFDKDSQSIWSLNLTDEALQQLLSNYTNYWFMQ
jgi:Tol biopolymer transport system component